MERHLPLHIMHREHQGRGTALVLGKAECFQVRRRRGRIIAARRDHVGGNPTALGQLLADGLGSACGSWEHLLDQGLHGRKVPSIT